MIPLKDNIPTLRFPVVSVAIIVVNVIVFLLDQATGSTQIARAITPDGYPVNVRHFEGGLSAQYAMIPAHVTANLPAAWYTVFTSMFLHANWLHIGGDKAFLLGFRHNGRDSPRPGRLLFLFFFFGVAAGCGAVL